MRMKPQEEYIEDARITGDEIKKMKHRAGDEAATRSLMHIDELFARNKISHETRAAMVKLILNINEEIELSVAYE